MVVFLKSAAESWVNAVDGNRRGQAGLSAEELCEMAGDWVAHIKGTIHNAPRRFAKQSSRKVQA
jgi:hypothetical protein